MVGKLLEADAFGVTEKQQKNSFRKVGHLYLEIVVVGQQNAVVFAHHQAAQMFALVYQLMQNHGVHTALTKGLHTVADFFYQQLRLFVDGCLSIG